MHRAGQSQTLALLPGWGGKGELGDWGGVYKSITRYPCRIFPVAV